MASVAEIDELNILNATHLAMRRAVQALGAPLPDFLLVDGLPVRGLPCDSHALVGGDGRSLLIAAASVMAKVARDRHMRELDELYPGYGLAGNKGYGTRQHLQALERLGVSPVHRRSFAVAGQLQDLLFPQGAAMTGSALGRLAAAVRAWWRERLSRRETDAGRWGGGGGKWLKRQGYDIVGRRVRPIAATRLIWWYGAAGSWCLVEVKTRRSGFRAPRGRRGCAQAACALPSHRLPAPHQLSPGLLPFRRGRGGRRAGDDEPVVRQIEVPSAFRRYAFGG